MRSLVAFLATALVAFAQTPAATPPADPASNPASAAATIKPGLPTIFIAGDSTAARGRGDAQQGWGVPFADYLNLEKVNLVNAARGGRSSRTFVNEGLWDKMLADVKKGDTVLIQFGHNDGGSIDARPQRGSIPGLGEETQQVTNLTTNQPETVHTFGWYVRKMIADVKAKQANPIVLSLTERNIWRDGRIERGSGRYSAWNRQLALDTQVPFVDVMNLAADKLEELGAEKTKELYQQDVVHYTAAGADLHAAIVISGLKGLRPSPVANFLSAKGEAVKADRHAWLRLPRPANDKLPNLILIGDSTVRNGRGDGPGGQWGWGDFLDPYFDTTKINIVNRAVGGTGTRTFIPAGYWEDALAFAKPGDVVMIQFGHNDNGAGGPMRGIGPESEDRENAKTKQKDRVLTFGGYLRKYIADIRAKGATPVLCTLIPRKQWQDGKILRPKDSHADWTRAVAKAENVALVDLYELIATRYDAMGEKAVDPLFADERVHTGLEGAKLNASIVVEGLKALPQNPVAAYLKPAATAAR
jgi:lysophospholipase L1-like esterase